MITIFCGNILQFYVYICLYCNFDSLYLGSASPFYSSGLGWFVAAIAQPGPERWWGRGWAQWHESWWDIHIFWDPKLDVDEQWWTCQLKIIQLPKNPNIRRISQASHFVYLSKSRQRRVLSGPRCCSSTRAARGWRPTAKLPGFRATVICKKTCYSYAAMRKN